MSTPTRMADEYASIAQRLAEIEREKTAALNVEAPKPDYSTMCDDYQRMTDWDPA